MKANADKAITFVTSKMRSGGARRVMSYLISHYCDQGYKVQLVLLFQEEFSYQERKANGIPNDVEICCLKWTSARNPFLFFLRIRKLRKTISSETVVSFLFQSVVFSVCACLFSSRRIVVSERNDPKRHYPGIIRKLIRTASYFLADAIVFQTEDAKNYFPKAIQKKGTIIPNPITESLIIKEGTEREKRIVSACRLSVQKNIPMAIEAFAEFINEYPDYVYEIYGEGPLEQELKNYIATLGLQNKVILKGFFHNLHDYIINAMMFVSSSDYEGISNSMLEAMAIGLPVICTDCPVGGARQTITNDHDGILIPVGDVNALKEAMLKIAGDKEYRDRIAKNAMGVRERYKTENICREWEKVINGD